MITRVCGTSIIKNPHWTDFWKK